LKIAFVGEAGAGKDFITEILTSDFNFVRVSFSDQLKKLGAKIYPWLKKDYSPKEKELPLNITIENGEKINLSPREIWLNLNCLRKNQNTLFISMLESELKNLLVEDIVISDIRTEEEYNWCRKNGFSVIYIKNENSIHEENSFDDYARSLENKCDYIFNNDTYGKDKFFKFFNEVKNDLKDST